MILGIETFKLLGVALALGLLVGAERSRERAPGEVKPAGVRTFAILCLLGGLCGIFATTLFTAITFAAVAGLFLLSYYRSSSERLGLTTEVAAFLVFWIGYLLSIHQAAAVSLGITLTILLAAKRTLHGFVQQQINEAEFEATLKFLAVVLVVYPVLPNRAMGPYGFFNPQQVWGLVILVSTISYAGYFLTRWLGARRGLLTGSLAGGLVSTTAVTMSLAERARATPEASRLMGTAAVLAATAQGPRLLLMLGTIHRELAVSLTVPLLGMALVGLLGAWLLGRRAGVGSEAELPLQNPYSVKPALKFGLFFVAILLLVEVSTAWLGDQGSLLASAVAGAASTSAVALSIAELLNEGSLAPRVATAAVLLAVASNALFKWLLAWVNGTRSMAFWFGGGLLTMLLAAFVLFVAGP